MFDFENPFKTTDEIAAVEEQVEELTAFDSDTLEAAPAWEDAAWERITATHAQQEHGAARDEAMKNQGKREAFEDFYHKRYTHRKERVAVDSARYAALAIGLTAVGYIVRSIPWLAITLGSIALALALIAAYGAGKYREM